MKIPIQEHSSHAWRIHDIAPEFRVLDVWALPTPGGRDDFPALIQLIAAGGFSRGTSRSSRALFGIRWKLGELLGWDDVDDVHRARRPTLRDRLPADLRGTPTASALELRPFTALYLTDDECAAEIVNRTVHGVLHIGWVENSPGSYRGQMAVLVKPNGSLGRAYLAAIAPFRYLIVYPAMMRQIGRAWQARPLERKTTHA